METKNKIVKTAKICYTITKVLYCLSFLGCLAFIILSITLSRANAIDSFTAAETAVFFATLAIYAFVCIGLLWNIQELFNSIAKEHLPFSENVSHYLKKIAIFILMLAIAPAIIGTTALKIACPETELVFPISISGIIGGIVLFLIGMFFKYGTELQKRDDETL